jgi:hypothetical protein
MAAIEDRTGPDSDLRSKPPINAKSLSEAHFHKRVKLGCYKFTTENARDQEKTRTEKQHSAGFWRNSIERLSRTQSPKLTTHQS